MEKSIYQYKRLMGALVLLFLSACEPFLEVDVPNDRITGETVFSDDATAREAMNGVYIQLFNTAFAAGGNRFNDQLCGTPPSRRRSDLSSRGLRWRSQPSNCIDRLWLWNFFRK